MNGYVESDKFPIDTLEAIPSYTKDFNNYQVEEKYTNTLFEQVQNLTKQGIHVIGYRPPVSQTLRILEDSLGNYNEAEIKSGIQKAGGFWIDLDPSKYTTYDGSHLDKVPAERLSTELAIEIKKYIEE
ncbi:MAG: hypothetical protein PF541_12660 [Prolixibacteraceae bacterium]|jgi:hypothetical protein|nr:hypothetical protein [Prolixibacteraceae bacterium]